MKYWEVDIIGDGTSLNAYRPNVAAGTKFAAFIPTQDDPGHPNYGKPIGATCLIAVLEDEPLQGTVKKEYTYAEASDLVKFEKKGMSLDSLVVYP